MEVTPVPGTPGIVPVAAVKRIAQVRKGQKRASQNEPDETDKPIPEPAPGTGQVIDLYV
jgi:hypothetical protein